MPPRFFLLTALILGLSAPAALRGQAVASPTVDSLIVQGNVRLTRAQILGTAGLVPHQTINYRDVQRAITALFETGQFDSVEVKQTQTPAGMTLVFQVTERPVLQQWSVEGAKRVSEGNVRDRVKLVTGRALDRAAVARARGAIDSLYRHEGYYTATVNVDQVPAGPGKVRVIFQIDEGSRVSISQVAIEGNHAFPDDQIVGQMGTRPEGFWWFQPGRFEEQQLQTDMRERLPNWYASHGYLDFEVSGDTLLPDTTSGKATLQLTVSEGPVYRVGSFEINGNQRFSSGELTSFYPFAVAEPGTVSDSIAASLPAFDAAAWNAATEKVKDLYSNNGYIYAQVQPIEDRHAAADGTPVVNLKWLIQEGAPATVNKIDIVGNDVTHERVIREQIVMYPGQVFSRDALIRSWQNISNLGFFQQPMPPPDVNPLPNGDVDIVFRVEEKRTGNINFGASLGQGTGIGGFLGLAEPNLFGRGKRGQLQWQFGAHIQDFTLSYTDPAIRESRVSGTITLFDSRVRYTIADLGRRQQTGGSIQFGFPFFGARYTRLFASYGFQRIRYTGGSIDIRQRFNCEHCSRSTLGLSVLRDTRVGLPFATGGTYVMASGELNGGILGGTGQYRKLDLEGRWYAPLGSLGGTGQLGSGIQFVLGFTAKSGFIFGDAGPFFTELYSLGGVQFGIPLRGYSEFCVTPDGYDPNCGGNQASPNAFGKSYAAFTVEAGARLSQSLYVNTFFDAGNVYRSAREYDPTRLFRGAGVGAALVSPLGPIGVDLGYGFDKVDAAGRPAPGWQLHFKLGNFF